MDLAPLLSAPWPVQVHTIAGLAAFALGSVHLLRPKGTAAHRAVGWGWVVLMLLAVASSFFIHRIQQWGLWSWIHVLALISLVTIPLGVHLARTGRVLPHRHVMWLAFAGLVIAGSLAFWPDRIMHRVTFPS